ncbi:MAG: glycerol kinase GlpK [Candidatus Sericytochromatia bacterium]|nr:glycerol kinase GlpK [Candidatus Sericytochromatia bacterium]
MREGLVLAIDQGTTGSTALLFDHAGRERGRGYREIAQHYPQPGWVEHDPIDILERTRDAVADALAAAGSERPVAIGLTNQRETVVVWDRRTGAPIHRAIVWQCRRTAEVCADLREQGHEDRVRQATGLVLDPYFSGTKLAWILDAVPGARARAEAGELAAGTIDVWLIWHLTGGAVHATDPSNASRTMLYDLHAGDWSDELCALLRVPRAILPDLVPSSGPIGMTVAWGSLPAGVPITGCAGDQQAALFGQGCFAPGEAKNTYGTGCFLLVHAGERPVVPGAGLLGTVAWQLGTRRSFAVEGSVFVGGAAVQWLRDGLGLVAAAHESELLARSVPDSGGVVMVPAFTGLGAPYWDADARGALLGLTRGTTRAHVVRATLEAIAHQVVDLLEAMEPSVPGGLGDLRVDGGASANALLMELQADLGGRRIVRGDKVEATARGAAMLAGLGAGYWAGPDDLPRPREEQVFAPRMEQAERTGLRARWARAVDRIRGPL